MIDPKVVAWYLENGYTLLETEKPPVGQKVEGAKVVVDRGFGGVIERTRRIGVDIVRIHPDTYYDLTNASYVVSSEIEAWK